MIQEKDTRKRILKAALKEFSANGYGGARMDKIAKNAKVNKAMIFYYFSSKEMLHRAVVKEIFDKMAPLFGQLVSANPSPGTFIYKATEIYSNMYAKHPDFIKMVAMELLQNPKIITSAISDFFQLKGPPTPVNLKKLIGKWVENDLLVEKDPLQFMLNLASLGLLSFMAFPLVQSLFGESTGIKPGPDFREQRIESVSRLLKLGMLTAKGQKE